MAEPLCGVCETQPKKYKCPACALPYCSLSCFKIHKVTHPDTVPTPSAAATPSIPQPPPLAPTPRYLKNKTDFSVLATNPKFQELLKTHPVLLSALQRVYAKTLEPDPEKEAWRLRLERQAFRGRGNRGRGRGGRWHSQDNELRKWTQKKGMADAMGLLKGIRDGKEAEKEKEAMAEFVSLIEEVFGEGERKEG